MPVWMLLSAALADEPVVVVHEPVAVVEPSPAQRQAERLVRVGKPMFVTGASLFAGAAVGAGAIGINAGVNGCSAHCFGEAAGLVISSGVGAAGAVVAIVGGSMWGAGVAKERHLTWMPVVGPGSVGVAGRF